MEKGHKVCTNIKDSDQQKKGHKVYTNIKDSDQQKKIRACGSKLANSLVIFSLKFQMLISQMRQYFVEKM